MFVVSLKSSKIKLAAIILAASIALLAVLFTYSRDKQAATDGSVSLKAGTNEERLNFLSSFGWEAEEEPVQVSEVIIPEEFSGEYEKYNEIQKAQKLDLLPYAGKRAKRWTYNVKNYPGYENRNGVVQANILVYEGAVIGGDICSLELEGFMQGFNMPNRSNQQMKK